jgi:hypothetical protein
LADQKQRKELVEKVFPENRGNSGGDIGQFIREALEHPRIEKIN